MSAFTTQQALEEIAKAEARGIYFNEWDKGLAKNHPDSLMGILRAKEMYAGSKDPAVHKQANELAESIRFNIGNYKSGSDGSGYNPGDPTHLDFEMQSYQDKYGSQIDDKASQIANAQPYKSKYQSDIESILNGGYDISSNPIYQAYAKANGMAAQQAASNAMGSSAALTGGMSSSAAVTAAQQAANTETAKTSAAIPGIMSDYLQSLANQDAVDYGRYQDQANADRSDLEMYRELEGDNYQRFIDDTNLGYGQWSDYITDLQNKQQLDMTQQAAAEDVKTNQYSMLMDYYNTTKDPAVKEKLKKILGL